jgi:hypothetical protein
LTAGDIRNRILTRINASNSAEDVNAVHPSKDCTKVNKLPSYPIYIADAGQAISRLSKPDGVGAYFALWHEYHYSHGLPKSEEKIRRIAGFTSNRKWERVREELMDVGFTHDWRNPKWDAIMSKQEKAYLGKVDGARLTNQKRWGNSPAPEPKPVVADEEIPF